MESRRQYLDTNILVFLHSGDTQKLGTKGKRIVAKPFIFYFSPMVKLELQYLFEIGKINLSASEIISDLNKLIDLRECDHPFKKVTEEAIKHYWTRDPFDRIIIAQASLENNPLITHDRLILKHYKQAIW